MCDRSARLCALPAVGGCNKLAGFHGGNPMLGLSLFAADAKHIIVYIIVVLVIIGIVWFAMRGSARA